MARKTYNSTGWIFKSGSKARGSLKKYSSNRVKVSENTDTPRAKILAQDKTGGLGNSVMYREHIKSGGYVSPGGVFTHPKKAPQTRLVLEEYQHLKPENKPPLVNLIVQRMQTEERVLNGRRIGYVNWNHYIPVNQPFYKMICCFSGDVVFFVEHDQIADILRVSRDYTSARAREIVHQRNWKRIIWFKIAKL